MLAVPFPGNSPAGNKLAEKYFHIVVEVKMKVSTPHRAIADPALTTDNSEYFHKSIILFMSEKVGSQTSIFKMKGFGYNWLNKI